MHKNTHHYTNLLMVMQSPSLLFCCFIIFYFLKLNNKIQPLRSEVQINSITHTTKKGYWLQYLLQQCFNNMVWKRNQGKFHFSTVQCKKKWQKKNVVIGCLSIYQKHLYLLGILFNIHFGLLYYINVAIKFDKDYDILFNWGFYRIFDILFD